VSARSKQKWLTIASLKQGLRETKMVQRDGKIHAAQLQYDEPRTYTPFLVTREVVDIDGIAGNQIELHQWWFASLDEAREHWKSQAYAVRG